MSCSRVRTSCQLSACGRRCLLPSYHPTVTTHHPTRTSYAHILPAVGVWAQCHPTCPRARRCHGRAPPCCHASHPVVASRTASRPSPVTPRPPPSSPHHQVQRVSAELVELRVAWSHARPRVAWVPWLHLLPKVSVAAPPSAAAAQPRTVLPGAKKLQKAEQHLTAAKRFLTAVAKDGAAAAVMPTAKAGAQAILQVRAPRWSRRPFTGLGGRARAHGHRHGGRGLDRHRHRSEDSNGPTPPSTPCRPHPAVHPADPPFTPPTVVAGA